MSERDSHMTSAAGLTTPAADYPAESRGGSHPPNEARAAEILRTVRVPLEPIPDATWIELRRLAYQCAGWGNRLLSESYLRAKGGPSLPTYTDARGVLSAAIRDAVSRECVGIWRRLGKKILRGEQTLARYSADRALVVRDRGIHLERDAEGRITIALRLVPKDVGELTRLRVYMPALRRSPWLRAPLDAMLDGSVPARKAWIEFARPGRKVFLRLAYARKIPEGNGATGVATFTGQIEPVPGFWLRSDETGHRLSFQDRVSHLISLKTHYAGLHERLRRSLGKRGRRYQHRRVLAAHGTFEEAATGLLHTFARAIVTWCQQEQIGALVWAVTDDSTIPWNRLRSMIVAKTAEAGIAFSQIGPPGEQMEESRSMAAPSARQPSGNTGSRKRSPSPNRQGVE